MLEPQQSLAFSLATNPGVYALLLGSGVSRSAGIPTGWDIVLDLLAKLAASHAVPGDVNPVDWFREKFGQEPEYSRLLDELARTPAERQQLLRPYFEPNEDEREAGAKQPTDAHRVIAKLVVDGYVRVIVTTNFDQLIETALRDEGVTPTVLSTADQVKGSLPLVHTPCCVLKVHGDYTDPGILNSTSELGEYSPAIDNLLDQIFDQFGLIVCGWSAEWDVALCNAIARAPSRRFSTFWASRGGPGESARKLIQQRDAQTIAIETADIFFQEVQETVASIAQFSQPHPLSTQAAVETLKRYLPSNEHRIRRADHIDSAVRRLVGDLARGDFPLDEAVNPEAFLARVRAYEAASSTLLTMAVVGGNWAEEDHIRDWERAIRQLCHVHEVSGKLWWVGLRNYPALLLLYALGFGLVKSNRLELLGRLFNVNTDRRMGEYQDSPVMDVVYTDVIQPNWNLALPGQKQALTPLHDRLHEVLREPCSQLLLTDEEYSLTFDKLEILVSLSVGRRMKNYLLGFPMGCFLYRVSNRVRVVQEVVDSFAAHGDNSPFALCGLIGSHLDECLEAIDAFRHYVGAVAQRRGVF